MGDPENREVSAGVGIVVGYLLLGSVLPLNAVGEVPELKVPLGDFYTYDLYHTNLHAPIFDLCSKLLPFHAD